MTSRVKEVDSKFFTPRDYQLELLSRAVHHNTIVSLGTGTGKTFIAVLLIKEYAFRLLANNQKVVFLVDKVALVEQQAAHIESHTSLSVGRMHGKRTNWSKPEEWSEFFKKHHVLVLTAQVLVDLINHGYFDISTAALIILDECHHSMGRRHPYRVILDVYRKLPADRRGRILGLTASVLNKRMPLYRLEESLKNLEEIMCSRLEPINDLCTTLKYGAKPTRFVQFCLDDTPKASTARKILNRLSQFVERNCEFQPDLDIDPRQPIREAISRTFSILDQLGTWCAWKVSFSWQKRIAKFIEDPVLGNKQKRILHMAETAFRTCTRILGDDVQHVRSCANLLPFVSSRMSRVIEILKEYEPSARANAGYEDPMFCLIFVDQRYVAYIINQDEVANIARQMNRGPAVQKCNKCSQSVPNEYKSFKDHVLKFHLAECRSITDRDSFLSKYIQICFPFTIALNDFMCTLCGREFKSFSGRKSHVCNEHITVFLDCPRKIEGCTFSATTSEAVERHIKKDHPDGLSDVEQSAFLQKKKTFNNMIIPIIKRCFPCPIPQTERIEREELAAFQRMMAKDAQNQPVAARTQNELPKTRRPRARRSSSSDEEGAQLLNGSRSRTVPASIGAQVNANLQVNNTNQNNANNLDSLATEINIISANKSGTPTDGPPTSRISANALRNKSCERPYSTRTRNYSEMVEPQLRQSSNEDQRRTSNRPLPRRRSSPQRQVQPEHNSSSACNRRRSNNRSRSSVPSDDRRNERDRRRSPLKKHDHSPAKRTKPSPLASVPSTSTRITQRQSNNPRNSPNASSTFPSNLAQTAHSSMGQMTNPLPSHAGSSDHSRSGVSRFSNANVTGNFNTTLPYHKANPVMPSFTPLNPTTLPLMDFSVPPPPLPNNVFGSVSFNAFYPRGPADATYGNAPVGMMTKMEENRLNPQIFTSNVTTSHPNGLLPTSLTNTKNIICENNLKGEHQ